ncbi:MAG: AlpA family phage regulatory protein [Proteobacteria bacterium]|nr:AlpA family phage regulatory protein [Pseudomonadota bacterium]
MSIRILRIKDVCQLLGVSRSTFYQLRVTADFPPAIPLHKRVVGWQESDIEAFVRSRIEGQGPKSGERDE